MEDVEVAPPKAHEVRVKILWTGVFSQMFALLMILGMPH